MLTIWRQFVIQEQIISFILFSDIDEEYE